MALQPGDKAPNFSLYDTDRKLVNLKDFKGKNVVLLFFPMAFSSVCTKELCGMRDDIGNFEKLDAQILASSVDTVVTLGKFKEMEGYNFPLLSDFNKVVSKKYGAQYASFTGMGMKGVAKRAAFVIDKKGVIRYAEVLENAGELPNFAAVQTTLASL